MRNIYIVFSIIAVMAVSACSQGIGNSYRPVVDQTSSAAYGNRNYSSDLTDCQGLASQSSAVEEGAKTALGGAAVGAALGAITGAFTGNPGTGAALGAAVGGAGGAAAGGYGGVSSQERIVKNCMRGRGWNVLD